jgi:hypothetical protein
MREEGTDKIVCATLAATHVPHKLLRVRGGAAEESLWNTKRFVGFLWL